MHISAKVDYAVRALLLLAERAPALVTAEVLSAEQDLPREYAEQILTELRKLGYVVSKRGARGGFQLARPAAEVLVGPVLSSLEGPFVTVRATLPDTLAYRGVARHLPMLWGALDDTLHGVLDRVTLADLLTGELPTAPDPASAPAMEAGSLSDRGLVGG
ncbi:MAG: Rrf2 family transcriptional regulator [Cellulomonas sp.]|uniref:Rrf2 family transcriptional regulator n=1 Tax=Cellulomonas gelida TaxID=1712 RepID=A0A4Y3KNQ4_9CELL|nr:MULTISPECIES: Rrf2 family transcriptional regulator [Cellulomonas]MCR6649044.1 Rrf2 family transcriptional regulator [Cellulomonas sp.]MCR6705037.1 Rrf2 family transcriptional regulator [Cellulomonas sp.]GEA85672.1 Rrf2 family transcriptional regulator [Cellulomonas gelida]GGL21490.1 Rrf2 family transcriptional regulator [Cellulomonas gelida]